MRLFDAITAMFRRTSLNMPEAKQKQYSWTKIPLTALVYHVKAMADKLSTERPLFRMRSGGIYAVAVLRNRKGIPEPACFIRVDKDRRHWKERKRTRRTARKLAEATV